jgi:adenosylcobinamide-GDP ribazoletransferase
MKGLNLLKILSRSFYCTIAWVHFQVASFLGAVIFYTRIPLPASLPYDFDRVARWSPGIGLIVGGGLAVVDWLLMQVGMPSLTRSAAIVALWIFVTGAFHLDGAMDTADGLGGYDRERRLEIMRDSHTGAFGAIAAVAIVLLKTSALSDLALHRDWALMAAAGWGRWGQVMAIAFYPYLRPTGKGARHKQHLRRLPDALLATAILLVWTGWQGSWLLGCSAIAGSAIALGIGYWFYRQLGGHTGDTYGAVVEWTEALLLCGLTLIVPGAGA